VLISFWGWPCSGKTTISNKVSEILKIPLINRDTIKESIFDEFGCKDREWSAKVGQASIRIINNIILDLFKYPNTIIIENIFRCTSNNDQYNQIHFIADTLKKYSIYSLQIICDSDINVIEQRFFKRISAKKRHPGHCDKELMIELVGRITDSKVDVYNIGGDLIRIDTNDLSKIDYELLVRTIKSYIFL